MAFQGAREEGFPELFLQFRSYHRPLKMKTGSQPRSSPQLAIRKAKGKQTLHLEIQRVTQQKSHHVWTWQGQDSRQEGREQVHQSWPSGLLPSLISLL